MVALGYSTSKAVPPLPKQYSGMLSLAAVCSTWRYLLTLFLKAARRGEVHCRPSSFNRRYFQRDLGCVFGAYFKAEPFKLFLQDVYEIQPPVCSCLCA